MLWEDACRADAVVHANASAFCIVGSMELITEALAQPVRHADGCSALQVRHSEIGLAVAAVAIADNGEQGLVVGNIEQLPVAGRGATWAKTAAIANNSPIYASLETGRSTGCGFELAPITVIVSTPPTRKDIK